MTDRCAVVAASLKASRIRVVDLSRNAISDRGATQLADEREMRNTFPLDNSRVPCRA